MRISDWSSDVCSSELDAGASAGDTSGGHGKAETPSTGHHLLFVRWRIVDDPIISGIIGIAAQECLCEPGEIEIGPLFCRTFAIVSHGVPRRNRGGASGVVRPLHIPTPCGGRPKKGGGPPDDTQHAGEGKEGE